MSETPEPALLPCPFCGSGAKFTSSYSAIMCLGGRCHAFLSRSVNETSHDLALRWNTRAPDPELARLRAELAAAKAESERKDRKIVRLRLVCKKALSLSLDMRGGLEILNADIEAYSEALEYDGRDKSESEDDK